MDKEVSEYKQFIRKFPTYNILEYFSSESMDIYKNSENGIKMETIPYYDKKTGCKIGEVNFHIAQWDLLEVCFNSIKYGNDYRNKLVGKNEFYHLLNVTKTISEKLENAKDLNDDEIFKHLICISNMEFDFETLNIQNKFNRLYQIMTIINNMDEYDKTKKVNYINFKKKFKEITNIDYDKYIKCYMFIVVLSITRKNTNIMDLVNDIQFDVRKLGFTKKDIENIIVTQSREYTFYRQFDNWNILKYNPIVHSERFPNRYIITNIPALLLSFSEFMYWTIRNYYRDLKKLGFTNYFGHCFEFYLNEFLNYYKIKHEKIDESSDKMPDWKIETSQYVFLVEQKAAIYPIDTRTITSKNRIKLLSKYLDENIGEAFIQLNNYKISSDKTVIRVCLTFEDLYFTETIQELVLSKITTDDEYLNWVVPINDFEKLFIILSNNEQEFNTIIEKKIELEKMKYNNGRGFDKLLSAYKNDYILNVINYFKRILDEELEILKKI